MTTRGQRHLNLNPITENPMRRFIAFLMILCLAPLAHAAPANANHVPADAKWYVHLDLEAARLDTVS